MLVGVIGAGRIGRMHARTLRGLGQDVLVADADAERARKLADDEGLRAATSVPALLESADCALIAAATHAHRDLVLECLQRDLPVFCEKPVALDVAGTRDVVARAAESRAPLQIGLQRRFDRGYQRARRAVQDGELGWVHTLRAVTADAAPPPAEFVPTSGGIFRDCGLHDFDAIRWITGREISAVSASGGNRGAAHFRDSGDVDTAAALLELDDGTLATATASRYNGAGHDVRLEVCGSEGALFVGHDDRAPMPSAEEDVPWPRSAPYATFADRFADAYRDEVAAFMAAAVGERENPCGPGEALEALCVAEACELSRAERRAVAVDEVRRAAR
jgi:myo-inositol 2-dehydrogenase/D-chiro-inositol 1-dehydrogenase